MLDKKIFALHYHVFIPMFFLFFLNLGVFITVNQTQQNQSLESNAATTNCTVSSSLLTMKSQEQTLLGEINMYRIQNNIAHLIWDNTLKQSAAWQSMDMKVHNSLSHTDSLRRTTDIRLTNCGYDITKGYGENIAQGSSNPTIVFNAWKNDPPHNQILLNPIYNVTGIAMEVNSSGVAFWTMDLGVSSPNATLQPPSNTTVMPTGNTLTTAPTTS